MGYASGKNEISKMNEIEIKHENYNFGFLMPGEIAGLGDMERSGQLLLETTNKTSL